MFVINDLFNGFEFGYKKESLIIEPTIISPYDIIREIETPKTPFEKYVKQLPVGFIKNAKAELYRKRTGWIEKGIAENKILKYFPESLHHKSRGGALNKFFEKRGFLQDLSYNKFRKIIL